MSDSVNPLLAAIKIWWAMRRTRPPRPRGNATVSHDAFAPVLRAVAGGGLPAIGPEQLRLDAYLEHLTKLRPDKLTPQHALAYWINLYNANALALAGRAHAEGLRSVLRARGAFAAKVVEVSGEALSLDAIEHGKIRRFGDPRIHGSLVCGSASCPTLRYEPFDGDHIDRQLDDQMRTFLRLGGAEYSGGVLRLSKVFSWYSGDIVRGPPRWIPAPKAAVAAALMRWLPPDWPQATDVEYMDYDWGLGCAIR